MNVADARKLCQLHEVLVKGLLLTGDEVVELALFYNKVLERLEKESMEGK